MKAIEIIIILALISFFSILIGRYIYKKIKHIPTGECACCAMAKKNPTGKCACCAMAKKNPTEECACRAMAKKNK